MKFKIPHVFIFLSIIILFCTILTYIIPSGSFDRTTRKYGKIEQSVVVPGSYQELPKHFSAKGVFDNAKALDAAVADMTQITGQKPVITKARKSIANFTLRTVNCNSQGNAAICCVDIFCFYSGCHF